MEGVWPDGYNIFHDLDTYNNSNWPKIHNKFAKVGSKVCQTLNIPTKVCLRLFKVCPSGEISPNLVTLYGSEYYSHVWPLESQILTL